MKKTIRFGGYDLPPEAVLAALYNNARAQGMGCLSARPGPMTLAQAAAILTETKVNPYFDYLYGRVMKVVIEDDPDLRLYIRDNGREAAGSAVADAMDMATTPGAL